MAMTGQQRVMRANLAFLSRADGSCSFSSGKTVVWTSVNGPGDVHSSRKLNERMAIECCLRPASGEADAVPYNNLLQRALEQTVNTKFFPRSSLQVTVHEVQSDGSLWATALCSAGLAVLDSGVPCSAPFCGVQIARVKGDLVVDPDEWTESQSDASFLFALAARGGPEAEEAVVIGSESSGVVAGFSLQEWKQAEKLAQEAAKNIFRFFRECLQRKLSVESIG